MNGTINSRVYNEGCISGMRYHVEDGAVDMVFTDPPYGISGDNLDQHYARDDNKIVGGYVEVENEDYAQFSMDWVKQINRVLKPGGSAYIVSGYTNLHHILNALHATEMVEVNHLIVEYSFGVYTSRKYVSSHYHMLFWAKRGDRTFNTDAMFADSQKSYHDRLSVQPLKREYQTGKVRYQNQLPASFIKKYILYSSNPGDVVLDPFSGSFSTRDAAVELDRKFIGFELNKEAFDVFGTPRKTVFDFQE